MSQLAVIFSTAVPNLQLFCVFPQEEHSIIAEEEGIVQVPMEGNYK